MDRRDETDPEKTLIRPRTPDPDKTIIVARQGAAASKPTPVAPAETAPAAPPKPLPAIRVVAFGLAAFVFLGATAGLVTVYLMSGGTPEVSDESLNQQLVSVEPVETQGAQPEGAQPEVTEIAPPQIIGLSGDPITVQRRDAVSRKLTKLSNAAAAFVAPLGIGGEIYRLNDALSSADSALATGVPGSQQSYAFFASGEVEGEAPAQEESTVGDGADNTSTLAVNADMGAGPPPRLELAKRIDQDSPVSKALVDLGFTEQSAGEVERSFGEILHVQSLSKADAIAVRGFLASPADGKLNLGQISLYRDGNILEPSRSATTAPMRRPKTPGTGKTCLRRQRRPRQASPSCGCSIPSMPPPRAMASRRRSPAKSFCSCRAPMILISRPTMTTRSRSFMQVQRAIREPVLAACSMCGSSEAPATSNVMLSSSSPEHRSYAYQAMAPKLRSMAG